MSDTDPMISPSRQANRMVDVTRSCFVGHNGAAEYNFMLRPVRYGHFADQLEWLEAAMREVLEQNGLKRGSIVLRRFFCSDLPNQIDELRRHQFSDPDNAINGAVSLVNQPPVPPAKVTLWIYCIDDPDTPVRCTREGNSFIIGRGRLEHVWTTGCVCPSVAGSHAQTHAIFSAYQNMLRSRAMNLRDNCLRTWFYVKDVDANYAGLVKARNEVFAACGLGPETHYIASTGIQGSHIDIHSLVMMDAYAVRGLQDGQVRHLHALDHLSHTHVYGVAFERASSIAYADRRHIVVSGTASIDASGEVVHTGDVMRQLDRTLENIEALLRQDGAAMEDMQHFIVYLRDPSDAEIIRDILKERIGDKPFLVVTGPVCRPAWLVEIEGIAIVSNNDDSLPAF